MPHHRKPRKIIFLVIIAAGGILSCLPLSYVIKKTFSNLAFFKSINSLTQLRQENIHLKEQILSQKRIIASNEHLLEESQRLKEMLSLATKYPSRLTPAAVINKNPWTWSKEILIDKGSGQGIKSGNLVINFQAHLIGKIIRVQENESWVRLLTDPNFRISVTCNGFNTLLAGALFEGTRLLYVPFDAVINENDTALLPDSYTAGFDIVIGTVSMVKKSRKALTQTIFVRPSVDLNILREVFVVAENIEH